MFFRWASAAAAPRQPSRQCKSLSALLSAVQSSASEMTLLIDAEGRLITGTAALLMCSGRNKPATGPVGIFHGSVIANVGVILAITGG